MEIFHLIFHLAILILIKAAPPRRFMEREIPEDQLNQMRKTMDALKKVFEKEDQIGTDGVKENNKIKFGDIFSLIRGENSTNLVGSSSEVDDDGATGIIDPEHKNHDMQIGIGLYVMDVDESHNNYLEGGLEYEGDNMGNNLDTIFDPDNETDLTIISVDEKTRTLDVIHNTVKDILGEAQDNLKKTIENVNMEPNREAQDNLKKTIENADMEPNREAQYDLKKTIENATIEPNRQKVHCEDPDNGDYKNRWMKNKQNIGQGKDDCIK